MLTGLLTWMKSGRKPNLDSDEIKLYKGYKQQEISDASMKAYYSRKAIVESINNKHWDGFNENLERTTRKMTKMVCFRKSSKIDATTHGASNTVQPTDGKLQSSARSA
jgi:protein tyrosine/serine phosphatase